MARPPEKKKIEFGRAAELTEDWLSAHEGHQTVMFTHTVFKGKSGIKYRECRCYTCKKMAREAIGEASAQREKHTPEKNTCKRGRPKKGEIKNRSFNEFCSQS